MFDLKIKNAKIVDGTGLKPFHGDIAIIGNTITWHNKPIKKSFGFFNMWMKSLIVNPRPKPNIIRARHIGAIFVAISIEFSPFQTNNI